MSSALILVTFLLFAHAANNGFMFIDDGEYVAENPHVQAGVNFDSLRWALTTFHCSNWHPLTWISHEIDCQIFGTSPVGPHLVNAGIHAMNTALLFAVLIVATQRRWPSAFCAAVFGWHPLRVESVVWIAERKDVLSVFFFLLALLTYLRYANRPALKTYALVLLFLTLGLLAKPMLVMAPVLFLLLDYWPLKRLTDTASFRSLVFEKLPLFALSGASATITIIAQHSGAAMAKLDGQFSLYARLNNAATSIVAYMAALVCPIHLAPFYPFPTQQSGWKFLAASLFLFLITAFGIQNRRRWPYLLVGWLWFIAALLPVLGLLQVGGQSRADRYSYIPSIGLLIAVTWVLSDWYERSTVARPVLVAAGISCTVALIPATYRQIGYWKNDVSLFAHAAAVTRDNWLAEGDLAVALARQGDLDDAEMHIRKSLTIRPHSATGEEVLARIEQHRRELLPGEAEYSREIRANPSDLRPHYNWGNLLLRGGRVGDAIIHYRLYLEAHPDDQRAHNNLAVALATIGTMAAAEREFSIAVELDPNYADAHCGLATALFREAKYSEAAENYSRALQLDPAMRRAQLGLEQCRAKIGSPSTGS
jgi:Flp pilus assembly protein TadD